MRSLTIRQVVEKNKEDVEVLLKKIGKLPQDFPFFRAPFEKNFLLTAILYENNKGLACGHMELRGNHAWLEIISTENKKNEFIYLMIKYFIEESEEMMVNEIKSSITKSNKAIVKIYEDFNFKKCGEKGKNILLKRKKII